MRANCNSVISSFSGTLDSLHPLPPFTLSALLPISLRSLVPFFGVDGKFPYELLTYFSSDRRFFPTTLKEDSISNVPV